MFESQDKNHFLKEEPKKPHKSFSEMSADELELEPIEKPEDQGRLVGERRKEPVSPDEVYRSTEKQLKKANEILETAAEEYNTDK